MRRPLTVKDLILDMMYVLDQHHEMSKGINSGRDRMTVG